MAAATVNKERWSLAGATALLTGGSKGIGHAIVEERVFFFPLRTYALTLSPIGFALRSVQTPISKQIRIEMCVCTLLKANPMGRRVSTHALKGKENFTELDGHGARVPATPQSWRRSVVAGGGRRIIRGSPGHRLLPRLRRHRARREGGAHGHRQGPLRRQARHPCEQRGAKHLGFPLVCRISKLVLVLPAATASLRWRGAFQQ
ncbi:hypothetical protein SORBI_3005G202600 [Sorghum bicolor]|uniref:Uncharacterized protein n=1 Tax=Sorghum bicolor TaxID=4558 RepID=C5Y7C1_SORBI|nr:hypothetical protein SORBI_3005G202600 [Sorghum bicolor]